MGKNRILPFGYKVNDGKIIIDDSEAKVVRMAFNEYIYGASYVKIADLLQRSGVRYHANTPAWNKQMISRMLENRKYIGTDEYPQIIDSMTFERAAAIKKSRYVKKRKAKVNAKPPVLPVELRKPKPSMAATRLQNEVTRALSMPINEPGYVRKLIFDLAVERFRNYLEAQMLIDSNQMGGDIVAPFE